ncbi:MAG TPA: M1 family metallopeptidase [Vicinamibacteria bacterium]|nr:M1 family metallopeptidase [Vicinamibacteria bacterium]
MTTKTLPSLVCQLVLSASVATLAPTEARAQTKLANPLDKFRQLEEILPTPNDQRTASGAPGSRYWQQKADYVIDVELDEVNRRIIGRETITYKNNSPDTLTYLWLQLDQNAFRPDSDMNVTRTAPPFRVTPPMPGATPAPGGRNLPRMTYDSLDSLLTAMTFQGGHNITAVTDAKGTALPHTIVKTMMRIELPQPMPPQGIFVFNVSWNYNINDGKKLSMRTGFESFPKDGNDIFEIAQWFPRFAAYTDVNGWHHKQYLGSGEFTLEFGDYLVRITAPEDHIVGASGVLQNPEKVLTAAQRDRLSQAATAKKPVLIVTPEEAKANEKEKSAAKKTWIFKADNVRDFAFASSRKFIWDAQGHTVDNNKVMAMSYYPKEGNPLWEQYSTAAIIHTLNVYSRYSFTYPYPVAISVNGPIGGMEYPMICFNGPRPEEDGTYIARRKYGLISVVIHEVGHNYFPMIVNSDERQWTWMDEGLNSFLQILAEVEWEKEYPSTRGEPRNIVEYMTSAFQDPIMINSESAQQLGPNAYTKPATGLTILRETILGRELFDYAFKEYSRRWKFKRPEPADFFRTMEDASGVDLDWFWRGWFYSTDHADQAIESIKAFTVDTRNPEIEKALMKKERAEKPESLSTKRNAPLPKKVDAQPELKDFYNTYDELDVTAADRKAFADALAKLEPREKELLGTTANFYVIGLRNVGGLVMPVILKIDYADGTSQEMRIPAEIWRRNSSFVEKMIVTSKEIKSLTLDPHLEIADTDLSNNAWPPQLAKSRFQLFKEEKQKNPMQELEKKGPGGF